MAGNAHLYSTAVGLPNETLAPVVALTNAEPIDGVSGDPDLDKKESGVIGAYGAHGAGGLSLAQVEAVHEEEMPEGPPTSRWEEWAYVSRISLNCCARTEVLGSTCTIMVILA